MLVLILIFCFVLYIVPEMDHVTILMVGRRQIMLLRRLPLQMPHMARHIRQCLVAASAPIRVPVVRVALQGREARLRRQAGARVVEVFQRRRLDVDQGHDGIFPLVADAR